MVSKLILNRRINMGTTTLKGTRVWTHGKPPMSGFFWILLNKEKSERGDRQNSTKSKEKNASKLDTHHIVFMKFILRTIKRP